MKTLIVLLFVSSCTLQMPRRNVSYPKEVAPSKQTHQENMSSCIFRLIEKNGISAEKAGDLCKTIYRRE